MTTRNQNLLFNGTGTGPTTALNADTKDGSTMRFQVKLTSTGSIAWEHTVDGTNWTPINATNESTLAVATSTTAAGIYTVNSSASFAVRANISANGSGIAITATLVTGGGGGSSGSGGGGGGGAVTVIDGGDVALGSTTDAAVTDPTQPGTLIALTKGLLTPSANPPGFQLELNDGTPVGDTAAHGMFVKTGGAIAVGSSVTGVLPSIVGGRDDSGNAQQLQMSLLNAAPNVTTEIGVQTLANLSVRSGSFANPVRSIGDIGDATTALLAIAAGIVIKNPSGTYDVLHGTNGGILVAGSSISLESTLAVTASAYTAGFEVGALTTLTNAMRYSGGTGVLQNLMVVDHSNQKPNLDIVFFKSTPAATFADHAAFPTLSQTDCALIVARISIAATDWVTVGGSAIATPVFQPKVVGATGSANLLMALTTTSTPTFAATTDIMVTVGFLQD